jgi:membrane associated rhomboid family serine protease
VGNIVERRLGATRLLTTYFGSVVAVGVAIVVMRSSHPRPGSSVGASGGIFALLVCALILLHRRDAAAFGQDRAVRMWLWIILAAGLAASLLPGVSLTGHAVGGAVGLIAGWALRCRLSNPSRDV